MTAAKREQNLRNPQVAEAQVAVRQLQQIEPPSEKATYRLGLLMRNAHAIAKTRKSFKDLRWLCALDEAKGLDIGKTNRTDKGKEFIQAISETTSSKIKDDVQEANVFKHHIRRFYRLWNHGTRNCIH